MKKIFKVLVVLFSIITTDSIAQTAATPAPVATDTATIADFYAGKWELLFSGTPQGDVKLIAHLKRTEGVLSGELSNPSEPDSEKIPITKIEEEANKIIIYFSAQGYDLDANLEKVDDNNLKGMLFNMFEAKAVRVK